MIEVPVDASKCTLSVSHTSPEPCVFYARLLVSYTSGRKWHFLIGIGIGSSEEPQVSSCWRKMKGGGEKRRLMVELIDAPTDTSYEVTFE